MRVVIEFDCDNASFEDYPRGEIRSVIDKAMVKIMRQLDDPSESDVLMDSNGNRVGTARLEN